MAFKCSDLGETHVVSTPNSLARTDPTTEGRPRSDSHHVPGKERVGKG